MTDDYDDEEFEDYDEDFAPPKPAINKPTAPPTKPSQPTNYQSKALNDSKTDSNLNDFASDIDKKTSREPAEAKEPEKISLSSRIKQAKSLNNPSHVMDDENTSSNNTVASNSGTSTRRVKKFGGSSAISSAETLSLDPRYRRLTRLLNSGVLDLQEEKFSQANILPSSKYELYSRQLRGHNPPIRQIGAPSDLEIRDVEIGTDEIAMIDEELQFSNGDDTTFLNVMKAIQHNNKKLEPKINIRDILLSNQGQSKSLSGSGPETQDPNDVIGDGSRLLDFLHKSAAVMETLLDESSDFFSNYVNDRAKNQAASARVTSLANGLFADDSKWRSLGDLAGNGANELIRCRPTVVVRHSELQPYILLTAHPPLLKESNEDLRPFKALYALWEINNPGAPSYILESQGSPTCATFSRSQTFIVAAGTAEGCLYLWDLREPASYHKDRDSIDLKIDKGIRKPCYSTHFMLGEDSFGTTKVTKNSRHSKSESEGIASHNLPIAQIESLGEISGNVASASVISQFVSLDVSGLALLWVTSNDDGINNDPGMSPWSQIKLVPSRSIHTLASISSFTPKIHLALAAKEKTLKSKSHRAPEDEEESFLLGPNQASKQFATCLAPLPNDLSSFLVAGFDEVHRISRFGTAPYPRTFDRFGKKADLEIRSNSPRAVHLQGNSFSEVTYKGFITCLSTATIRASHAPSLIKKEEHKGEEEAITTATEHKEYEVVELMLVGRSDGGVDLFRLNHSNPVCSWNITDYDKPSKSSTSKSSVSMPRNASVVTLKWCPSRKASFFVVDNHGIVFYFDLLENFHSPIAIEPMNINISSQSMAVEAYLSSSSPLNSASPKGPAYPSLIDISQCRQGSKVVTIAIVDGSTRGPGPACNVKVRKFKEDAFKSEDDEENKFVQTLDERIGKLDENIVARVISQASDRK